MLDSMNWSAMSRSVKDLLARLAGPAADEIGSYLADRIREYRVRNAVRALERTHEILSHAGIAPSSVPLRVLVPLLDGASLEDNDELSQKWAQLLATAATPGKGNLVLPGFANTLSRLRPIDARILDLLLHHENQGGTVKGTDGQDIDRAWTLKEEVLEDLEISESEFALAFSNLRTAGVAQLGARKFGNALREFYDLREIGLTEFGSAFMRAVSCPLVDRPDT